MLFWYGLSTKKVKLSSWLRRSQLQWTDSNESVFVLSDVGRLWSRVLYPTILICEESTPVQGVSSSWCIPGSWWVLDFTPRSRSSVSYSSIVVWSRQAQSESMEFSNLVYERNLSRQSDSTATRRGKESSLLVPLRDDGIYSTPVIFSHRT